MGSKTRKDAFDMERIGLLKRWVRRPRFWLLLMVGGIILLFQVLQLQAYLRDSKELRLADTGVKLGLVDGRLMVTSIGNRTSEGDPTPANLAGIEEGDHVLSVSQANGERLFITGMYGSQRAFTTLKYNSPWTLFVGRPSGEFSEREFRLEVPPVTEPIAPPLLTVQVVCLRILLPLLCLGTGLFIGLTRIENSKAFLAALLFFACAFASPASYGILPHGLAEARLLLAAAMFSSWSYLFMRFFLLFPSPSPLDRRFPDLKVLLGAFPVVFAVWNTFWSYTQGISYARFHRLLLAWGWFDIILDLIFVALFLVGFLSLILNIQANRNKDNIRRLFLLLAGSLGLLPALISG